MNEDIEYLRSPRSNSGWHFVAYHTKNKRYQVYYKVKNVRTYIGSFPTAIEAARAYHETTKDICVDERKAINRFGDKDTHKSPTVPKRDLVSFAIERNSVRP